MQKSELVTIRDLAEALGLSHSTVSRALAGHPHIHERTRARVRALADELGYVANASARTLRGAKSRIVGLVVPDVQNDFYAGIARRVADALAREGRLMVLAVTEDDPDREQDAIRSLVEARASGVIITASASPHAGTLALFERLPVVQLLRTHRSIAADAVVVDDEGGIAAATEHLCTLGHRRIAYLGAESRLSTGRARLAGFERAMRVAGLACRPEHVALGPPRPELAREAVVRCFSGRHAPTALVAAGPELTLGALQGLTSLGLAIPDDVSLVGYGDPAWFAFAAHGLTTVRLPVEALADAAVRRLLERLDEDAPTEATVARFETLLLSRRSCRPLRARAARGVSA